jgi:hypothetical protein
MNPKDHLNVWDIFSTYQLLLEELKQYEPGLVTPHEAATLCRTFCDENGVPENIKIPAIGAAVCVSDIVVWPKRLLH